MRPTLLTIAGTPVPAYATLVLIAIAVGFAVRRSEVRRLGYDREPGYAWLGVGALLGAMVGAKLGMLLFEDLGDFAATVQRMTDWDFTGKTVVGGLAGGYVGVEIHKKLLGITRSTGDAWALALPLGQAIGRLGCWLHGCCGGAPSGLPWAVQGHHPAQLYEAALDLALFSLIWRLRGANLPRGHLFRAYLVGYATIRFALEWLRADARPLVAGLSAVQCLCLVAVVGFGRTLWTGRASAAAGVPPLS